MQIGMSAMVKGTTIVNAIECQDSDTFFVRSSDLVPILLFNQGSCDSNNFLYIENQLEKLRDNVKIEVFNLIYVYFEITFNFFKIIHVLTNNKYQLNIFQISFRKIKIEQSFYIKDKSFIINLYRKKLLLVFSILKFDLN